MGGKDLEVEIIPKGLKVMAPIKKVSEAEEPFSVLQHFTDFLDTKPLTSTIVKKHKELLQLNQNLLRRLSYSKKHNPSDKEK